MGSTTSPSEAQLSGWVRLSASGQFAPYLASAFSRRVATGALTVYKPNKPRRSARGTAPFCAIFPGYTGDATTHERFIVEALRLGIGLICVNPAWGTSVKRMRENAEALLQALSGGPARSTDIQFIRAVSFGAWLSLFWWKELCGSATKVSLVTPCASNQLPAAGQKMGLEVRDDDLDRDPSFQSTARVRILTLLRDEIVPETDNRFSSLSSSIESLELREADHFTAGDHSLASVDVAQWFGEQDDEIK